MARMDLEINSHLWREIEVMATESGVTPHDILRRGLAVLVAFSKQRQQYPHVGFATDPSQLDVCIVNVL